MTLDPTTALGLVATTEAVGLTLVSVVTAAGRWSDRRFYRELDAQHRERLAELTAEERP